MKRKPHLLIIMWNMKIPKRHPTFSKLLKITSRPQDKLTPNEILESVTYIYSYILAAKVLAGISSWFHWVRDDIQTFLFTFSVPSQRIKDVLPKEIIERIRKSSQKSRTIAIIEPVQHDSPKPNDANRCLPPFFF